MRDQKAMEDRMDLVKKEKKEVIELICLFFVLKTSLCVFPSANWKRKQTKIL